MWVKVHGPVKRRTMLALVVFNVLVFVVSITGVLGSFWDLLFQLGAVHNVYTEH